MYKSTAVKHDVLSWFPFGPTPTPTPASHASAFHRAQPGNGSHGRGLVLPGVGSRWLVTLSQSAMRTRKPTHWSLALHTLRPPCLLVLATVSLLHPFQGPRASRHLPSCRHQLTGTGETNRKEARHAHKAKQQTHHASPTKPRKAGKAGPNLVRFLFTEWSKRINSRGPANAELSSPGGYPGR